MKSFTNILFGLLVKIVDFVRNLFFGLLSFFRRIIKCFSLMSSLEKRMFILLIVAAVILSGVKFKRNYFTSTVVAPGYGGAYEEAVAGEIKYTNPISVSSDAEKSLSRLLFSSLVKFDKDNKVINDAAEKWEVSPDGLKYTFTLRSDVSFQNGDKLRPKDILYTVEKIKDPLTKSPMLGAWQDVEVSIDDSNNQVIFDLPRAYGPFIYNCDFGILPSNISDDELAKKPVGSGPYTFKSSKSKEGELSEINLTSNNNYFLGRPFISRIELELFRDKNEAKLAFSRGGYNALSGVSPEKKDEVSDLTVSTQKRLGLIFNLRLEKLKDKAFRQSIIGTEKLAEKTTLTLSTLDSDLQREKAEELKKEFVLRNIDLDVKYLNSVEMKEALDKKDYELLLYGFDFGHDRDPYAFWHSSQMNQSNFAGFSDKKADLILEDARMTEDYTARNALYDQFFDIIKSEDIVVFYDPVSYHFFLKKEPGIKGLSLNCSEVECRFNSIEKWFMKEKRVRKQPKNF